ncbi:DegV family protein [Streptococcus cameli]
MTFRIVTDSTADLPKEWITDHQITVLGLTIQLDGVTYETTGEEALTSGVLLEKMAQGGQPTTSQVNVGQFEAVFEEAAKNGEDVFYIAFSSALSGTYQSGVIARDMVLEKYPDAKIAIVDTKAATIGEGYLVLAAAKARQAGKDLDEAVAIVEEMAPRLRTYLLVDDLNHLVRGGRLSKAAAMIGGLVNIKPLIAINREGRLDSIAKIRGRKKGIREMISLTLDDLAEETVMVAYTGDASTAEEVRQTLLQEDTVTDVIMEPLGPVIAAHVGHDVLALLSFGKIAK